MSFKFNPLTGKLDLVGTTTSGGGARTVEYRTLNNTEATNKQLTLGATPADATETTLDIVSGVPQQYAVDFSVSGTTLTWNGLGLDVTLEEGDTIRITYSL